MPTARLFCSDAALGYAREAWRPEPGAGLTFDDQYRLAHLPLVAPGHPLVIAEMPGRPYRWGRRPASTSLVLRVDDGTLGASPAFAELACDIAAAPFAPRSAGRWWSNGAIGFTPPWRDPSRTPISWP